MMIGNALSPFNIPRLVLGVGSVRYDLSYETRKQNTPRIPSLARLFLNYCFGNKLCFATANTAH